VDLKDIKSIIDLMKKNSIAEFELEKDDFKIRLKRGANGNLSASSSDDTSTVAIVPMPAAVSTGIPAPHPATPQVQTNPAESDIKSPMIGTFYRAPSPDAAPYVEVGTEVTPESVVCIIEAMKVMNEIKAEAKGVITQNLVDNGKPVEFGQPLFKIRLT
jgi:acetyl-CoA carboxylase biotin carboxyl carrier protein